MIRFLKTTSEVEQKVQKVESLMRELGLKLDIEFHNLVLVADGKRYPFVDTEQHGNVTGFPRTFESERLRVND